MPIGIRPSVFYLLSKPLWFLATPSNALVFFAFIGLMLTLTRFARLGRRLAFLCLLLLIGFGVGSLGTIAILPLEQRFPPMVEDAPAPTGIIILGGAVEERVSVLRGGLQVNEAGDRILAMLALAKRYPNAKLLFSGGSGEFLSFSPVPEAEMVKRNAASLGLDPERLLIEARSRNTVENAQFSAEILKPKPGETWWIVTSAFHMPRAVGCFRAAGFDVKAYPVDYRTASLDDWYRPQASVGEGLRRSDIALKEWVGLGVYWMTGKIGSLFPAP